VIATAPSLRSDVRALPRLVWTLLIGTFINRCGTFVMPFMILHLTRRGYSEGTAGLALSTYGIGHLSAALLGGHLADRLGRRKTIIMSMFSSATVMLLLSQATSLGVLSGLIFCAGLCAELYGPAASALLVDLCPPERRVTASAFYRLANNLGLGVGPTLAGLLAQRSFFLLFVGDAATSMLFAVIALQALPRGTLHPEPPAAKRHWLATALADRRFVRFLLASLAITLVLLQMDSTLALHIKRAGHPPATYGALLSINGFCIVLFEVLLTTVTRRMRARSVMSAGFLLSGIGFALTGIAFSKLAIGLTIFAWTMGEMISFPVAGAYVAELAPPHLRGRYMGLWGASWSLGLILGPAVGTQLPPSILWGGCGVLGVVSALLVIL